MTLILTIVFVFCMMAWLFSALPFPQTSAFNWMHPLVAWVAVLILSLFVLGAVR